MAIVSFIKLANKNVILERNSNRYLIGFNSRLIAPIAKPDIVELIDPELKRFKINWNDVITPVVSSRDDLFNKLSENFLFDGVGEIIEPPESLNFSNDWEIPTLPISPSETIVIPLNKEVSNLNYVEIEENPVGITITNYSLEQNNMSVNVTFDTSNGPFDIRIRIIADGETTPWSPTLSITEESQLLNFSNDWEIPTLPISPLESFFAPLNMAVEELSIVLIDENPANMTIVSFNLVNGGVDVSVSVDTFNGPGDFRIKIFADGMETPWSPLINVE